MLFEDLILKSQILLLSRGGEGNPGISGITADSRNVTSGSVYVAIPGTRIHGDSFIADALARGANAIISENPQPAVSVPWLQVGNPRRALGLLARTLWNVDVDSLLTIGITGTNGKTTTAHLFEKLLRQRFALERVWMFGTIEYHLGELRQPASHTTPESLDIFRLYGSAFVPPQAIVMEVSSHALSLDRVGGLQFDLGVWTNLTQDHLDFHVDMENYYQAKKRLFTEYLKVNGSAAINIDDQWGRRLSSELPGSIAITTFGESPDATIRITAGDCDWDGCRLEIEENKERVRVASRLRGGFNVSNTAALYAGARALEFTPNQIIAALHEVETVAGRMDRVPLTAAPYAVIVDYAHTPDALVNVLQTARALTTGKLVCVFGCGGDRDRTKRPLMAQVVAENADEAVLTSDNPRSESPKSIIDDALAGMPLDFPHTVISDRRSAIGHALSIARPGDCIVIAGKGHEEYQEIKGVRHHFSDKEVVSELFEAMERKSNV